MADLNAVLQEITNEIASLSKRFDKLKDRRHNTKFKGQKTGKDFTTSDLPHHGDYGIRVDTGEVQFNVDGSIYNFASSSAYGTYVPSPHTLSSSHHSGTLADSQAPQFVKLDGTRAFTGNLNMGNNNITYVGTVDGIDVSAHDHGSGGGTQIDHGTLSGLSNDDHPNYIGTSGGKTVTGQIIFAYAQRMQGTNKIEFYDADLYIHASEDGKVEIAANGEIILFGPKVTVTGNIEFDDYGTVQASNGNLALVSVGGDITTTGDVKNNGDVYVAHGLTVGNITTAPNDASVYVVDNVSALSFTDRTPAFDGDALEELRGVGAKANGEIDHDTLPSFARKTMLYTRTRRVGPRLITEEIVEEGRDIGAMVSVLTVAVQQLLDRVEALETQLNP